jgi:hypothetical protein
MTVEAAIRMRQGTHVWHPVHGACLFIRYTLSEPGKACVQKPPARSQRARKCVSKSRKLDAHQHARKLARQLSGDGFVHVQLADLTCYEDVLAWRRDKKNAPWKGKRMTDAEAREWLRSVIDPASRKS